MKNNANITNENDRNIKLELLATCQSANSAQATDARVGHDAATPAGLHLRECVGLRSPVSVSGRLEKENTRRWVRRKKMKTKRQTPNRDCGVEGRKSIRPDATRTPNGSITEGIMRYFLLRLVENKKLDWPNISVRGKYKKNWNTFLTWNIFSRI